jgi:hypothetical protein
MREGCSTMTRILVVLCTLALGACNESRGQDVASCQIEATKAYPSHSSDNYYDRNNYASLCMKAKGYVLNKGCHADYEIIEGCYQKPWPWE